MPISLDTNAFLHLTNPSHHSHLITTTFRTTWIFPFSFYQRFDILDSGNHNIIIIIIITERRLFLTFFFYSHRKSVGGICTSSNHVI